MPASCSVRFFPMGYPVDIATNSKDVLAAARGVWAPYPQLSSDAPVRLYVSVSQADSVALEPAMPRLSERFLSVAHGPGNYGRIRTDRGFGVVRLTPDVARRRSYVLYHFIEPLAYVMLAAKHFAMVHAACVAWNRRAVLLCGSSGAGKTCLAFECARRGWEFLSGDATHVVRRRWDHTVIGRPYRIRFRASAQRLFPELDRYSPQFRPNGKLDIEASTQALGLKLALSRRVSHVVFLNRTADATEPEIEDFSRTQAKAIFEETVCYGPEQVQAEQRSALSRLLSLPVLKLNYASLSSAETALRSLISTKAAANR